MFNNRNCFRIRAINAKDPRFRGGLSTEKSGGDLLSQGVYPQVPLARSGLTSVFGMGTGVSPTLWPPETFCPASDRINDQLVEDFRVSTSTIQALGRLVPVSSARRRASTSGLSTWWSRHGPYCVNRMGTLILERVSHLDAFSVYPFRR